MHHTSALVANDPLAVAYRKHLERDEERLLADVPRFRPGCSDHLTLLSFGGGQDSTAILYKILYDPAFAQQSIPGRLVVCMSDTGNEHPATLLHVAFCQRLCQAAGVEFVFLRFEDGFHTPQWKTLTHFYASHATIGSKAYPKTCTVRLKLDPIYSWLNQLVADDLGVVATRKNGLYRFASDHGKVAVWIGIASDEDRIGESNREPLWMQRTIQKRYPLVQWGWDRQACQLYIADLGLPLPPPSNCMLCPFLNEVELVWLHRFYPFVFQYWVELEAAKIAKWAGRTKRNLGVFGERLLPEVLATAKQRYGSMTDVQLCEHKQSHGHCVKSRY